MKGFSKTFKPSSFISAYRQQSSSININSTCFCPLMEKKGASFVFRNLNDLSHAPLK